MSAAIISAATTVVNDSPMPTRMPVKMPCRLAGNMTSRNNCQRVAPRLCAARILFRGTLRTAASVLSSTMNVVV